MAEKMVTLDPSSLTPPTVDIEACNPTAEAVTQPSPALVYDSRAEAMTQPGAAMAYDSRMEAVTHPGGAVVYDSRAEVVTLPGGVVSVTGVAVVTGGVELSCASCLLAFGFWGTLIGLSCVGVGLWDHWSPWRRHHGDGGHHPGVSHLLALGLAILSLSAATVGSVVTFHLLSRERRRRRRERRREGREVLVEGGGAFKKLTV